MRFIATYHTDVGISKKTNQDSLALKIVDTKQGQVAFGIVCDGMGGLSKGELASKEVTIAFCKWFDEIFVPDIQNHSFDENELMNQWNNLIQNMNEKLGEYGNLNNIMLGTTISAILIFKEFYYIVHVGDSRIYQMTKSNLQLTKDQTFIARELAAGRMTADQARRDPRRSVLLQCVGASQTVEPEFLKGRTETDAVYMLCSDGFRHVIMDDEMMERIGPKVQPDQEILKQGCIYLTELVKSRKENDNITVALIRTME